MSWLTHGSPIAASSGVSRVARASVSQVGAVSPVKWTVLRCSPHGPLGYDPRKSSSDAPIRDSTTPRWPASVRRRAYCSLSQLSGVAPGTSTVELVQHQSIHHCRTPSRSYGVCSANHASACARSPKSRA